MNDIVSPDSSNNQFGLQVSTNLHPASHQKIIQFCHDIGIDIFGNSASLFADPTQEMHSTVLASKDSQNQTVESLQQIITETQLIGTITGWKLLGHNNDMLTLTFDSPEMDRIHNQLKNTTGLEHNFNKFVKHITVHYNYHKPLPTQIPDFDIHFTQIYAKEYIVSLIESNTDNKQLNNNLQSIDQTISTVVQSRINNMSNILKEIRGNTSLSNIKIKP